MPKVKYRLWGRGNAAFKSALRNSTPASVHAPSPTFKLFWLVAVCVLAASACTSLTVHIYGILFPFSGSPRHWQSLELALLAASLPSLLFNPVFWRRHIRRNEYLFYQSASCGIRAVCWALLDRLADDGSHWNALLLHFVSCFATVALGFRAFQCLYLPELMSPSIRSSASQSSEYYPGDGEDEHVDDVLEHLGATNLRSTPVYDRNTELQRYTTFYRIRFLFRILGFIGAGMGLYSAYLSTSPEDQKRLGLVVAASQEDHDQGIVFLGLALYFSTAKLVYMHICRSANQAGMERLSHACILYTLLIAWNWAASSKLFQDVCGSVELAHLMRHHSKDVVRVKSGLLAAASLAALTSV